MKEKEFKELTGEDPVDVLGPEYGDYGIGESEKCPECGTPLVVRHVPNGDSDYDEEAECPGCGETFTT